MSEAMTNTEIEDVLSSIRRLVAQEARPAPTRLVLTAAQRVVPIESGMRPPAPGSVANVSAPLTPLPQPAAEVAAAAAPAPAVPAPMPPVAEPPSASVPPPAEPSAMAPSAAVPPAATPPLADSPFVPVTRPAPLDRAELEATIAALESALVEAVVPAVAAPAPAPATAGQPDPQSGAGHDGDLQAGPRRDEDIALIDEAELRALIGRLVRDELHGQLGERITLQVRKLVRAEIARALDERSFLA